MTAAIKSGGKLASVPPPPVEFKRDPRYKALRNFAISISIFTILGYTVLGFEQPWLWPFLALATGYTTEVLVELTQSYFERRKPRFMGVSPRETMAFFLPAHITSLAVNMLMYANESFWPVMFGVIVGVGAKAVLQAPINGRMRHFMNPSNFGIITTLVLFSWVNLAPPYMFTEHVTDIFKIGIPIIIITAGTIINATLTKRVPLIVGFLGAFVIQSLVRWWWYDVAISSALAVMTGVAFVLFTNYMITDPGTSPSKPMNQFMFGATVALSYGVLMAFNIVYTLFFATAITCGIRGGYHWVKYFMDKRAKKAVAVTRPPVTQGTEAVAA
jgi:enediyne biosynthesis protein E5